MLLILQSLDQFLLEVINLSYHNILLDNAALLVSYLGVVYFWIIIAIIIYLVSDEKGKNFAKKMIVVLLLVTIVTQLIKIIVMRPRPYTELSSLVVLATENDFSFPSGHTSTSVAMTYLLVKEYGYHFLWIMPIIVALSRLYIGVHYPSDILAGFIMGIIVAYIGENYINLKRFKF